MSLKTCPELNNRHSRVIKIVEPSFFIMRCSKEISRVCKRTQADISTKSKQMPGLVNEDNTIKKRNGPKNQQRPERV